MNASNPRATNRVTAGMTEVIDLRRAEDPRDVVHRVCHALADGQLVVLPTETQYTIVGSALNSQAVEKLSKVRQGQAIDLVLRSADESRDYWVNPPAVIQKLSRRCWPGPVVLSMESAAVGGLFAQLPTSTRDLWHDSAVRFRIPAAPIWNEIQRLTPAPLVSLSDRVESDSPPHSPAQCSQVFGDTAALLVDDGACRYGENTTVVHASSNSSWSVQVPGIVSARNVGRLASEVYLFVCTGNTCRSPMAEALFRHMLAERLQCPADELMDYGYLVVSAGLAASIGAPASPEGIELLKDQGIDLREHESQPLTEQLLVQADHIYTMTRHHREAILAERPDLHDRVRLLNSSGSDVSDPIGGGPEVYRACLAEIQQELQSILDQLPSRAKPA